ncbi:MAG TPA: zinc-ribbon domain-containing protein [Firmicutes bacterium]|nr:zinc-ribbon domain-containing protein [Bacillota bacterium]
MIQCPNCGAQNPDSAEKCEKCRQQLMPMAPGKTDVIIHETPKLPFIKRAPFRKG